MAGGDGGEWAPGERAAVAAALEAELEGAEAGEGEIAQLLREPPPLLDWDGGGSGGGEGEAAGAGAGGGVAGGGAGEGNYVGEDDSTGGMGERDWAEGDEMAEADEGVGGAADATSGKRRRGDKGNKKRGRRGGRLNQRRPDAGGGEG